jgi:hypothetical protein
MLGIIDGRKDLAIHGTSGAGVMPGTHRSLAELQAKLGSYESCNECVLDRGDWVHRRRSYGSFLTAASMPRAGLPVKARPRVHPGTI